MPTYTCWTDTGAIPPDARKAVVDALTEIHHEEALAPRYLVQVVFADLTPDSVWVAGQPVGRGHVWIRADIRSGRTDEQKDRMLTRMANEVGAILGVAAEEVWVYICDIPGSNMIEYGRALPEPGQEDAWFESLPDHLRERLAPLR